MHAESTHVHKSRDGAVVSNLPGDSGMFRAAFARLANVDSVWPGWPQLLQVPEMFSEERTRNRKAAPMKN